MILTVTLKKICCYQKLIDLLIFKLLFHLKSTQHIVSLSVKCHLNFTESSRNVYDDDVEK